MRFVTGLLQHSERRVDRVCADPENMPFSNRQFEGFENKIATLIAKELNATPTYTWWGQRQVSETTQRSGTGIGIQSTGGNDAHSTMDPYLTVNFIIKY